MLCVNEAYLNEGKKLVCNIYITSSTFVWTCCLILIFVLHQLRVSNICLHLLLIIMFLFEEQCVSSFPKNFNVCFLIILTSYFSQIKE